MKEEKEMRRFLVVLMLAVLVSQPLMAFGGSLAVQRSSSEYFAIAAEPERGCRYSGSDLTFHVPILINGTSDFVSQGWPGSGTQMTPYLISMLNISYDLGLIGIRIMNTEAYFVIRDCFVKQSSAVSAIELYNVTHAVVEYTTATSPGAAINCDYTSNLRISRSVVRAGGTTATTTIDYANNTILEWNQFASTTSRAMRAQYCLELSSEHNEYLAGSASYNCAYLAFCNGSSSQFDYSYQGYAGFYVALSHEVSITGFTGEDNQVGISVDTGPRMTISDCNIVGAADWGIELNSAPNATVDQCTLVDCGTLAGDSALYIYQSGDVQVTDVQVLGTGGRGIYVEGCPGATLTGNQVYETGLDGVYVLTSDAAILDQNRVHDVVEEGLYLQNCANLTVTDNEITEAGTIGICFISCNRADVSSNTVSHVGDSGIYFSSSDYADVYANDVSYAEAAGIAIEDGIEARTDHNTLDRCNDGIAVTSHANATITYNTIGHASTAVSVSDSSGMTIMHNAITHTSTGIQTQVVITCEIVQNTIEADYEGIVLSVVQDAFVSDNIILGSGDQGIRVISSLNLTFDGNEMTECGFIFADMETEDYYNHTFADNTVNGRPVYFMYNGSGLALTGGSYGQVILLRCQDVTVTGGTFYRSTVAIQAFYCEEIHLVGITSDENYIGFILRAAPNSTVDGLIMTDSNNGLLAEYCGFLTVDNCQASYISGRGVHIDYSTNATIQGLTIQYATYGIDAAYSDYGTVLDSQFRHISERGIMNDGGSAYWNVSHCEFYNVSRGVYIQSTVGWLIADSLFEHCKSYGVYVTGGTADNGWVVRSEFYSNNVGIEVYNGDYWHIINCTIQWSINYGIYLYSVAGPEIYGNTIALSGSGNGYSNNAPQYWDNGVDFGNSWDDYSAPPPYVIDGAGATDRYPSLYLPTEPIIDRLMDVYYPEFSTGNYISWLPYDDYLRDWRVEIDGVLWESGAWDFDKITVNVDGLSYGTYSLVITVWDIDMNRVSDELMIHVYDGTPPVISELANTEAFVGGVGQTLTWQASDLHPSSYEVLLDGDQTEAGEWEGGPVSASLDGLSLGLYYITMIVYDIDGNSAYDTVIVQVITDTDNPTIDSPLDVVFVVQSTGNQIIWTAMDDHPKDYEIVENDTVVASGPWNGNRILFSLDALPIGNYDFTITVSDGAGHTATDTVNVKVIPYAEYVEPPPPIDLGMLLLAGGIAGAVIVVVGAVLYIRKRRNSY